MKIFISIQTLPEQNAFLYMQCLGQPRNQDSKKEVGLSYLNFYKLSQL